MSGFDDGRGIPYDDRELDNSDDEDDGTEEPTLGAPNRHHNQTHWADGARGDHEREVCTDREMDHAECDFPGFIEGGQGI
ncbi:hypothetical protein FJ934_04765 [Mesorhizobium sp. B2-4-12]|uniref:hypothetical protein n=1 Tax=unclassified Mesorhizobium TaxID=325217 RepID=UPI0011268CDF|nr:MULTISPECIES: hypothetical protein [unclassified Mesorhizobium]TPK82664.1 hypothetical protein FJ548_20375 [Mesorhizobium sp. B2-4-17]TPK98046.1 hypothetical protein FJ934_04765 [Mesorhizobium sp. B2-4-12]